MKVDNAVIMAAGTSSRFAPLSYEKHKALTVVKDEVLIERQIKQLQDAGIKDIYIVTGYKADQFEYLKEKFNVKLVNNPEYIARNNNGSIWRVRDILSNSFICSADNYFTENPFEDHVKEAYYAAEYAEGYTKEWCMTEDKEGYINSVTIGGENAWYMLGHAFWSKEFSERFLDILGKEYDCDETKNMLWEMIYMGHLDELKLKIRKYDNGIIYEFDTLDELRLFDKTYVTDTRSQILKRIANELVIEEKDIINIKSTNGNGNQASGFEFDCPLGHCRYRYQNQELEKCFYG